MRRALLTAIVTSLVTAVAAQQAPPRDTRAVTPKGTAELAGIVRVNDAAAAPLAYAQVGVLGIDNGLIRVSSANADGRFRLQGLAAGKYIVAAFKSPYIGMVFGATRPGRAGTPVAIADGERREDLVISLVKGASISGVITDEQGRPAAGLPVVLQSGAGGSMYQQMMALAFLPAQVTDDRGAFRFSGVMPGEYLLTVNHADRRDPEARTISDQEMQAALRELAQPPAPPATPPAATTPPAGLGTVISTTTERPPAGVEAAFGTASGGMMSAMFMPAMGGAGAYAPVYYPGTVDPAEAQPLRVAAGEERHGVDFIARAVLTAQLSGTVINVDGAPIANVTINLRQTDQTGNMAMALMALARQSRVDKDGTFTVNSVPPGRYTLEARTTNARGGLMALMPGASPGASQGSQAPLFATLELVVQPGQSQTGLELRLEPAARVTGTVAFNATRLEMPKDASQVMVTLVPAVMNDPFFGAMSSGAGRASADGTFTIEGVAPGRYIVQATSMDPAHLLQWMPQTVTVAGRPVTDMPIEIKSDGLSDVRVTLTDVQQELSGRLQDASGRPASAYSILLFSTDRAHWLPNSRRVLLARPATDGGFTFSGPMGPPPGEYFLAALTDLSPEDQYKPSVLAEIAGAALKVTVAAGEKKRQDIRIAR